MHMSEQLGNMPPVHVSVALIDILGKNGQPAGLVLESRPLGRNLTNPGKVGFFGGPVSGLNRRGKQASAVCNKSIPFDIAAILRSGCPGGEPW